jgi:hypothetical protein
MPPARRRVAKPPRHPSGYLALMLLALAVFLALVVACLFWLPGAIVDRDRDPGAPQPLTQADELKAKNDVRVILLQGIGGLALLVGASGGIWATLREVRVSHEGQITERFTRAVEQLGSPEVDVRIGGLYALERIAEDSPADRGPIVEILAAFVRNHAPWPKLPPSAAGAGAEDVPHLRVRAADVAAAITVIGRSAPWRDGTARLELGSVDLRNAYLVEADLHDAWLHEINLNGAWLRDSSLRRAALGNAGLRQLHARRADLRQVDLRCADLEGADLRGAQLDGARLHGANLTRAQLEGTVLEGALADATTRWPEGVDPVDAGVVVTGTVAAR